MAASPSASLKAAVIADDLTGALEMGALLAARHLRTAVTMRQHVPGGCEAVVLDTESRNLDPWQASERVRDAARALPPGVPFFKKADSTLRGPIAAELRALAVILASSAVRFTPAYPALGRVVRGGCLYVNGAPLADSPFAHDPRSPTASSSNDVDLCDAATDDDLRRILDNAPPGALLAGSAGLGRIWAERLPAGLPSAPIALRPARPLLVCGSRHPASLEQSRLAAEAGVPVLLPSASDSSPDSILAALAESAARIEAGVLILFGGDTAAAVLARLGIDELWPVRELMPGIVLSRAAAVDTLVVTKAGGFGEPRVVEQILGLLK